MKKRTQDLKKSFHDAAQFYLGWRDPWKNKVEIFHKNSKFVSILKLIHINNYSEQKLPQLLRKIQNIKINFIMLYD